MENNGGPTTLDPIQEVDGIYDDQGNMSGVLDTNPDEDVVDGTTSNDNHMADDPDLAVNGYVSSIDFDGKLDLVCLDDIIDADNSVKFNMTAYYGQFLNKLGCQHQTRSLNKHVLLPQSAQAA